MGRRQELDSLDQVAARARAGHGAVVFIAGEAGVGKSRLAREAAARASGAGFNVLEAACVPEATAPYLPLLAALRSGGLGHLLSTERAPRLEYLYLASPLGMTMASAAREESPFDRDLFLSMLSAVESFVTDSLSGLPAGAGGATPAARRLNAIGFGEFRILILPAGFGNLVAILRGTESADLVSALENAIEELAREFGPRLRAWDGDRSVRDEFSGPLRRVLDSKHFEGDSPELTPNELKYRTLEALARGLAKAAAGRPIVIFLDDLHLADSATIAALQYLGRSLSDVRLVLMATFRAEEVLPSAAESPLAPARRALLGEGVAAEISLGPLDLMGIKALAEEQLGVRDLDAPFVNAIYRESHGAPFMAIELLRFLQEDGRIERVGGTIRLKGGVAGAKMPAHLHDAVNRRVSRLSRADRDILECAAVDGNVFSPSRVACALQLRRLDVLRALRNLQEEHRLVRLQGENGLFDHAKVHEAIYEQMHSDLRTDYHAAIARCCLKQMDAAGGDLTVVAAHHFAKARDPEGLAHILHAAERASVASSHVEAAEWYEAYLQLAGDEATAGILAAYGTALLYAGRYEKAERTFSKLLEMPTGEMERLTYLRAMAEAVAHQRGYSAAVMVMDRNPPQERGLGMARFVVARARFALRLGDGVRAANEVRRALPVLEAEGGAVDRADAYGVLAAAAGDVGDYDKAVLYGRKALEAVGEHDPAAPEFLELIGSGLLYRGRFVEAGDELRRGLLVAEARSDPFRLAAISTNLGLLKIREGDPKAARKYLVDSLRWAERLGTAQLVGRSLTLLGLAAAEEGRDTDAAEFFQRALPVTDHAEDRGAMVLLRIYLAQFELERGDPDLARKHAEDAYVLASESGDAPEQAFARGVVAGAVGISGDDVAARKMFDAASRGLRFSPSQYEFAEVMRMWGDYLVDCAEEGAARDKFEVAKQVFVELGAVGRARRVGARLDLLPRPV